MSALIDLSFHSWYVCLLVLRQQSRTVIPQPHNNHANLHYFQQQKKEERRKDTGILVWKRQATSQCVKTEYSPKWICGIITSELALVSDGTSVGERPVGCEWRPLVARVYYCLCTNNISEPRDPAGIVLVELCAWLLSCRALQMVLWGCMNLVFRITHF